MIVYNENDEIIDHNTTEQHEWSLANKYIKPYHVVLELGARYGTTSIVVDQILSNKNNQVCVEPDSNVWSSLEKNKIENNCEFNIIKGAISKNKISINLHGYASYTSENVEGDVEIFDLWDIQNKYNLKFNSLIADCEGCLSVFIEHYPDFFKQLELIIYEEDNANNCDYEKLKKILRDNNFVHVENGFHNVYLKF